MTEWNILSLLLLSMLASDKKQTSKDLPLYGLHFPWLCGRRQFALHASTPLVSVNSCKQVALGCGGKALVLIDANTSLQYVCICSIHRSCCLVWFRLCNNLCFFFVVLSSVISRNNKTSPPGPHAFTRASLADY